MFLQESCSVAKLSGSLVASHVAKMMPVWKIVTKHSTVGCLGLQEKQTSLDRTSLEV